jgi:hypothetical protein
MSQNAEYIGVKTVFLALLLLASLKVAALEPIFAVPPQATAVSNKFIFPVAPLGPMRPAPVNSMTYAYKPPVAPANPVAPSTPPPMPQLPSGGGGGGGGGGKGNDDSSKKTAAPADPSPAPTVNTSAKSAPPSGAPKTKSADKSAAESKDDGLCVSQKSSKKPMPEYCSKIEKSLDAGCGQDKVKQAVNKASTYSDLNDYCPGFANMADKQGLFKQVLASMAHQNNGTMKISKMDVQQNQACRGLDTNSDEQKKFDCGTCVALSKLATSSNIASAVQGLDKKALNEFCKGGGAAPSHSHPASATGQR